MRYYYYEEGDCVIFSVSIFNYSVYLIRYCYNYYDDVLSYFLLFMLMVTNFYDNYCVL